MSSKEEKIHKVTWRLDNPNIDYSEEKVKGMLFMPAALPNSHKGKWDGQPVMLDSHDVSKSTTYALTIMRDSRSDNILKVKLVFKGKSNVVAWVEPFIGNLHDYLESKSLGISEFQNPKSKFTLPTPNLLSVISQIIKGLEDLRKSGHYHGGFSLSKTYYTMDPSGVKIKLCNFEEKTEGTFQAKLVEDCWAVRDGLKEIREIADKLKCQFPNMDCCQLDGLIELLNNIGPVHAETAFGVIRRQPFFWGKVERKEFYVCVIPLALRNISFWTDVDKAEEFISLPWGQGANFKGYLNIMNKYRVALGLDEYDTNSRVDYVKFISGLYTHEAQLNLKSQLKVDYTVQLRDPALCYHLYALMPDANRAST